MYGIAVHNFLERACKHISRCDLCKIKKTLSLGSYLSINLATIYSSKKKSLVQICTECCMQHEVQGLGTSAGCLRWMPRETSGAWQLGWATWLWGDAPLFRSGHAGNADRVEYYYLSPAQILALVLLTSYIQRGILLAHKGVCSLKVLQVLAGGQHLGKS